MNLFRRLKNLVYSLRHESVSLRRWQAAKTDRINSAHWRDAGENHINSDLTLDLETLRQRTSLEMQNNPFLEGVVETYTTDLVGEEGPQLEVLSDDDNFGNDLEAAWAEWWAMPDINDEYAGVDLLDVGVRQLWSQGSWLWQMLTGSYGRRTPRFGVRLKLNEIHPRRLNSPYNQRLNENTVLGIERSPTGKPLVYHVSDYVPGELSGLAALSINTQPIAAANMIHVFKRIETGQVDGYPWAAGGLQVAAELRDYDMQVLDAARAAADFMVLLFAEHPDAPFFEVNESIELQRRQMRTCPPGWKPQMVKAEQPTTTYVDFRTERLREIGRPANMPVNLIRLDSSRHNFASARFDAKPYERGLRKTAAWICRRSLNRLVKMIEFEAGLRPRRPQTGYTLQWTWPVPRFSGDPGRDAKADDVKLKNMTATLREIVQQNGVKWDTHLQRLKKDAKDLAAAGILNPNTADRLGEAEGQAAAGDRAALEESIRTVLEDVLAEQNITAFQVAA